MPSSPLRAFALSLTLLAVLAIAPAAYADGTPNLSLSTGSDAEILYGDEAEITLTAANPVGQPPGYNLSLRAELPPGVTFVPGSGPAGVPAQVLDDAPSSGRQTIVFSNVSDLSPNSSYEVRFRVAHDPGVLPVGATFTIEAGAYVNSDARHVPQFTGGIPSAPSYTGWAETTHDVTLLPFRVIREAPDNQLRGAHDFQYRTRITIENNSVRPTSSLSLTDFAPAGVEVLACGATDNTTDAPTNPGSAQEYPGSGALNPGNAPTLNDCTPPDTVTTLTANPGGLGNGVWTRQVWDDLGTLAAGATRTIEFAAAIPIRENTDSWSGAVPSATSGQQAANLDNNNGTETYDEQQLAAYTEASGVFDGVPYTAGDTQTTVAEDLTLSKSASSGSIAIGAITTWTLTARASEYRWVDDAVIVDTVPDGLCPLGDSDYDLDSPECDATAGADPYASVAEQTDGTWTVTFDPLARIAPSGSRSVELTTKTRAHYQEGHADDTEVLANDAWTNVADVSGDDFIICTGGADATDCPGDGKIDADETDGQPDTDAAHAEQRAASPTLKKEVASAGSAGDCQLATYTTGSVGGYGPGDRVCWRLRMDFPGGTPTGGVKLTDFLPLGHTYEANSFAVTGANTVPWSIDAADAADGLLRWDLGTSNIAGQSDVFEGVLATTVKEQASPAFPGQLTQNLLKASTTNTPATTFPLRADAGITIEAPVLALDKSVADVNDAAPSGSPPSVVPGDVVTYRLRVSDNGERDAGDVEVWDDLPTGITCANVTNEAPGTCTGSQIRWTGVSVTAGGHADLQYDVTIPSTGSNRTFTNSAGVRSYTSATNEGGTVTYFPESNIDPSVTSPNAAPAEDLQSVRTPLISPVKTRSTEVTGEGANGAGQATIGEIVDYRVEFTVPQNMILFGTAQLHDPLARQTLVPGSLNTELNGSTTLPPGVTAIEDGNGVRLTFPPDYVAAADEEYVLTYSAQVDDVPGNVRGGAALGNTATLTYESAPGTPVSRPASTTTTIVEPNLTAAKISTDADGIVEPGEQVGFTVTARNESGGTVSTAHQVSIVDTVPEGMTPLDAQDGDPVTVDGAAVGPDGGIWDADDRTITWPAVTSLAPSAQQSRDYWARVDDPATSQARLTNTVRVTGSSLGAAHEAGGERTDATAAPGYADTAEVTLDIVGMSLAKDMSPAAQTIGGVVTGTLTVTVPANIGLIDAHVTDVLPAGLVFDAYGTPSCTAGCGPAIVPATLPTEDAGGGQRRLGWWIGDVAPHGAERTLVLPYTAHVADTAVAGDVLTNTAEWHLNRTEAVTGTPLTIPASADVDSDPETDTTTVTEPELTLDKQISGDADADDQRTAEPGDTLTYSIVVTNDGDHAAYDVTVTDAPDSELAAIAPTTNAGLVTDGWTAGDPDVVWRIPGPIDPGDSITLAYTAQLAPSAQLTPASSAVNTADVPSYRGVPQAERDANGFSYKEYTDVAADTVTLDVDTPQVTVAKDATGGSSAHVGGSYAWTITATNTATAATAYAVDIADTLPPNWTYDVGSATIDDVPAEPDVTELPAGDELVWDGVADLAAGEDVVIELTATPQLAATLNPGTGPGNPHVNRATVAGARDGAGATEDADGSYSDAEAPAQTILTVPDADLSLQKATTTPPVAGGAVGWRITVHNQGPDGSPDVRVSDTAPAGVTITAAEPSQGSCDLALAIECRLGELANGASATIDVTGTVDDAASAGASLVNTATVSDPAIADADPSDDTDDATDTVLERAATRLAKNLLDPLVTGRPARWELTVTNDGPSVARDVELSDTLPTGVSFDSAPAGCAHAAGVVTCAVGDLAPGQVATRTITTTVEAGSGTIQNTATAASPTPALDGGPNTASASDGGPVTRPDLAITQLVEGEPTQGATVNYVLVVSNAGGAATYAPTTVVATMPPGLVPLSAGGSGWTCRISGAKVTCTRSSNLAAGAAFPGITITTRVDAPEGTSLVVHASVSTAGDVRPVNDQSRSAVIADAVSVPSCAGGGRVVLDRTRLWAGARYRVSGRVVAANGQVVPGQVVRVQQTGRKARSLRTDAQGAFAFAAHPRSANTSYRVSVPGCGLQKAITARRATSCRSISVGPASLRAGRAQRVRIRLRAGGRPLAAVAVRLRGAGVNRSVRTNRSGRANVRVRPDRAGIVSVSAQRVVRCTRRVGVVAQATAQQLTG